MAVRPALLLRLYTYSALKIWNSLPFDIKQSQSLSTFRRHLKTHYFQSAWIVTTTPTAALICLYRQPDYTALYKSFTYLLWILHLHIYVFILAPVIKCWRTEDYQLLQRAPACRKESWWCRWSTNCWRWPAESTVLSRCYRQRPLHLDALSTASRR